MSVEEERYQSELARHRELAEAAREATRTKNEARAEAERLARPILERLMRTEPGRELLRSITPVDHWPDVIADGNCGV